MAVLSDAEVDAALAELDGWQRVDGVLRRSVRFPSFPDGIEAVRRVAEQICADLPGVHHSEIDIDENPELAQRFSILSLPTTLIFDAAGKLRYRTSGVPRADELRTLLTPWLA